MLAPLDYIDTQHQISFLSDNLNTRMMCADISIVSDEVVEDLEEFTLLLSTIDEAVYFETRNTSVFIEDSSSKSSVTRIC